MSSLGIDGLVTHGGQLQMLSMRADIRENADYDDPNYSNVTYNNSVDGRVPTGNIYYDDVKFTDWTYDVIYQLSYYNDYDGLNTLSTNDLFTSASEVDISFNNDIYYGMQLGEGVNGWFEASSQYTPFEKGSWMARGVFNYYAYSQEETFNFDSNSNESGATPMLLNTSKLCKYQFKDINCQNQVKVFDGIRYVRSFILVTVEGLHVGCKQIAGLNGKLFRTNSITAAGTKNPLDEYTLTSPTGNWWCLVGQTVTPHLNQGSNFIKDTRTYMTYGAWKNIESAY